MDLNKETNYIVSGLERSGTSMMMQILEAGDIPISFNDSRQPDEHNPKGYYELENGKIISKLKSGSFPLNCYKGTFIKVTAYGLRYLPFGKYKVIYMERNIDEVVNSMDAMRGKYSDKEESKEIYKRLNKSVKSDMMNRNDIDMITISYNDIIKNPKINIKKVSNFLNVKVDVEKMIDVIDDSLYRHRSK
jgi:LPS sulfotransferase NodH